MRLSWIRFLPMIALLFGVAVTVSACNTVEGTLSGAGKDISMIGNTLTGVVSDDCRRSRCDRVPSTVLQADTVTASRNRTSWG